jgi:hypothetical protein
MPHEGINWLAILVAAIIPMVVGGLWYSNLLFAKRWISLMGTTEEELRKNFNPAKTYGVTFVMCIVMAYVMDYFVHYTLSMSFVQGMKIGFALWVGLVVTTAYQSVTFQGVKQGLYIMNMGYNLVSMMLMGGLLAVWR